MKTIAAFTVVILAGCCVVPGLADVGIFEFRYDTTVSGSTNPDVYTDMQDTFLYVREPDLNYGGTWPVVIDAWSGGDTPRQKNVLIRFGGLADFLPEDFQVGSATLRMMFWDNQNLETDIVVGVYDMLAPWTEGGAWVVGGATWASADGTEAWHTAGAMGAGTDHAAAAMYAWTVPGDAAQYDWFDIPLDVNVVQRWIDDDSTNHGLVLYSTDNIVRGTTWGSNDAPEGYRPVLVIIADTDGDGIPDWWEAEYFGGPTNAVAHAYSDLSGFTNLEKYIAGLEPFNDDSAFLVEELSIQEDGQLVLRWTSLEGRVYSVDTATDLGGEEAFSTLAGAESLPATPPENEYVVDVDEVSLFEFKYNTTVSGSTNPDVYTDMQDTFLYVREPDLNYGSTWPITIDAWSGGDTPRQKNVLMRFGGLADFLPEDFQVGSATLWLQFRGNQNAETDMVVDIYDLLVPWTEGGATWATRDGTTSWSTAGAMGSGTDHAATAIYEWTVPGDAEDGDWFDIPLDTSVVQGWIDDDTANHGLVFYSNDNIVRGTLWYSNNAPVADRPVLEIVSAGRDEGAPAYYRVRVSLE